MSDRTYCSVRIYNFNVSDRYSIIESLTELGVGVGMALLERDTSASDKAIYLEDEEAFCGSSEMLASEIFRTYAGRGETPPFDFCIYEDAKYEYMGINVYYKTGGSVYTTAGHNGTAYIKINELKSLGSLDEISDIFSIIEYFQKLSL